MKNCLNKYVTGVCFLLLLTGQFTWAGQQTRQQTFQDGISAHSNGEYDQAIQQFESLAQEGLSAPLLYNLGNSYAQVGQSGRAILNYERALRLEPGDSDILGNLELVRKEKGLFQEEPSFAQRFVTFLGLNQWIVAATVSFVLLAGVLLLPLPQGMKQKSRYWAATSCLVGLLMTSLGAIGQYQHWHDGVVVAHDARLRVSPFASAASIGTIQEGRLLHPGKIHNTFVLVVDEAGRSGWLAAEAFEAIARNRVYYE